MPTMEEQETTPTFTCIGCRISFEGEPSAELNAGAVCEDCHGTCMTCDTSYNRQSGSMHAYNDDGESCGRCTRNSFTMCSMCDTWELNDNTTYVEGYGERVCECCLENRFWWCDDCDRYIHESWDHDDCGMNGLVHDYSYKPTPVFKHTQDEFDNARSILQDTDNVMRKYRKIPYLGFELEVECTDGRDAYREGANLYEDSEIVYLKTDGSLNYGFEIVSHPLTLDWAMENFPWDSLKMLEAKGFEAWTTDTAGIHVHVSRDGFESESHQAKFVHFFIRNEVFLSWLAGRHSSRWAKFDPEHTKNIKDKLRRKRDSERYMAVNLLNSGTLEVRIFRASLKPERLQMNLQLVDAVVRYTERLSTLEMVQGKGFSSESFMRWVNGQPRYEQLNDYLMRWVEPFTLGAEQIGE
jgi:hypothetical protein